MTTSGFDTFEEARAAGLVRSRLVRAGRLFRARGGFRPSLVEDWREIWTEALAREAAEARRPEVEGASLFALNHVLARRAAS